MSIYSYTYMIIYFYAVYVVPLMCSLFPTKSPLMGKDHVHWSRNNHNKDSNLQIELQKTLLEHWKEYPLLGFHPAFEPPKTKCVAKDICLPQFQKEGQDGTAKKQKLRCFKCKKNASIFFTLKYQVLW